MPKKKDELEQESDSFSSGVDRGTLRGSLTDLEGYVHNSKMEGVEIYFVIAAVMGLKNLLDYWDSIDKVVEESTGPEEK